jgi:FAD dependent oxidoreductase TIGR03364
MQQYDLIVIGAGALGTFHAYHAARAGKNVLLLEKDQFPVNATVRNFGQAVPSGLSADWFAHGRRSTALYNEIQKEYDISVRNNGSVYIASDRDEQNLLHELKAIMDSRQYECRLLNTGQCVERWGALQPAYCKEAIYFPQEISVEPNVMIFRMHEYCRARFSNFTYCPETIVTGCEVKGDVVHISAGEATFKADKVIVCNGHEFKLLFADLFRESGIVISKLQMLRTKPLPQVKLDGNILTGLTIRRYESFEECPSFKALASKPELDTLKKYGIHILFKKAVDGSIIIGDSHEYASVREPDKLGFTIDQSINELMLEEAQKIVTFNVRDISHSWAGFYAQHPDKPVVEYDVEGRIHIRTAIGGKGMTSSAGYAESSIRQLFNLS